MAFEIESGVVLRGLQWEGGDRRPFLLVHGLASNCRTWRGAGAALADDGHPVVAIDLRGHGQSDKPDDGYDFDTLTADLLRLLDLLGWSRTVVVGQSTGGNLAVELGHRDPDRLAGVAGVDGGALDLQRTWPRWEDCEQALAPPPLAGTSRRDFDAMLRRDHPDWSDEAIDATLANVETLADGSIRPWLSRDRHMRILRSLWEHRPSSVWPTLKVPVLLVGADGGDDWSQRKREELSAAAAVAANTSMRVEWFSPADHDVHVQHPRRVARLLHDWESGLG